MLYLVLMHLAHTQADGNELQVTVVPQNCAVVVGQQIRTSKDAAVVMSALTSWVAARGGSEDKLDGDSGYFDAEVVRPEQFFVSTASGAVHT